MIINSNKTFPIAIQKNLSYNINFTPNNFSLSTISFKEGKDFTFNLQSGKFSDFNNRSVYLYNTGENINLSGNIHHVYSGDSFAWPSNQKLLYDYYINGNPILLSGQRTGNMGGDQAAYSKISGLTISGSNLELTNFQILGKAPNININLDKSFALGSLISGNIIRSGDSENFRLLSGSVRFPTTFDLKSLPSYVSSSTAGVVGFNIDTNFNSQYSEIPLTYNITLNFLTDFGLISRTFVSTGIPSSFESFFIDIEGRYFDFFNTPSGSSYAINSSFKSGNNEYAKSVNIQFYYSGGATGQQIDPSEFYASGTRNINFDIITTGTGTFTFTGLSLASGYYDNLLSFGTGNLSGSFQTGITGGNFQKQIMITGSGVYDFNHFNLNTFIISGYRTGIWSSGIIVRSGTVTGYFGPFLSGSGTATFYNNSRFILNSNVPLGIIRDTRVFTGFMFYPIITTGTVKITGFNSTFLDYSGYSAGTSLTGLLVGSGFVYSPLLNQRPTTGVLRYELNNRIITGAKDLFITEFVINTGINLGRIVTMVSGEATGNYLNNPNIFGLSIVGTGNNIVTGSNFIYGQGLITGTNTGYIIKDNYITTGIVTGVFLYQATGNPNNLSDPKNNIIDLYSTVITGNTSSTGLNLISDIQFTGNLTSQIQFTGFIFQEGDLYSNPINFTGQNTSIYSSISGGFKTGLFIKKFENTILNQNTYFTGQGFFNNTVSSTGLSSGLNWTYFNGSGGLFTNKIFTGNIEFGSGTVYNRTITFRIRPSGIASGQIGNSLIDFPRPIGTAPTQLYISELKNTFFTGNKIEYREIIVSGIATGTKYNYQGLQIDYSGYAFSSGSGFLVGSGFVLLTGIGVLTGTDGSTGLFSTTGDILVSLTGNPLNVLDPVNTFYKYYNSIRTTGSGFYGIQNFGLLISLTGQTSPITLTGGNDITEKGYISTLNPSSTGFYLGTGSNLASFNSRTLLSGQIINPKFTGDFLFYTGVSNVFFQFPVSGIVTGRNDAIIYSGFVFPYCALTTGRIRFEDQGAASLIYKHNGYTGISGYLIDDIRFALDPLAPQPFVDPNYKVGQPFEGVYNTNATGLIKPTGFSYFAISGIFTGKKFDGSNFELIFNALPYDQISYGGFNIFSQPTWGSYYTGVAIQVPVEGTGLEFANGFSEYYGIASGKVPQSYTINFQDIYAIESPSDYIFTGVIKGWSSIPFFDKSAYGSPLPKNFWATGGVNHQTACVDFITASYYFAGNPVYPFSFETGITGVTGLWLGTGTYTFNSGIKFSTTDMTYASGKIIGYTITEINNSYPSYSGINFYTQYGYKNILKPKFNEKLTGNFAQDLIGSGFMSQSKQSIATGQFYIATGILGNTAFRTGYKDFNITGSYISINGAIDWTGNLDLELGLRSFYTGTTLLQDIRARSFEYDIFRTGIINLTPNSRFFETTIESQKFFFATGYINFRSGIDFVESDMGKKSINGLLLTGTGSVILPPNVFPISKPNFTGQYNFISSGTGFMTVTGSRQIIVSDFLTGITGIWETTGFCNVTGSTLFTNSDLGRKFLALNYTGQANTGTLYPIKSVYPYLFEIVSGFNHITNDTIQTIYGSGFMTGYSSQNQTLFARSGISGNLEFLGNLTGITTGIITGTSGTVLVSVTGSNFNSIFTLPYNVSSPVTGVFNFFKTFIRTGIFAVTGNALTTGSYQSKTNFLVSGLATGYFAITGTGIVNLTGSVILNRSQTLLINYPYPSGNSIAYLTLTGLNNFTGDFRSGVAITGLYNKNFIGLFSGSNSGSYTGMWSGTGAFTGSITIPFFDNNLGVRDNYLVATNLINSGLESGLVPVFTLGLYSGLRTIQNSSISETRTITGSGYFESIASGFGLAGTTSGSGIGLVTGYLSGLINKNYLTNTNYETGLILTGYLSGNSKIALTGIFTGTINLTGRIIRSNFNLRSSGIATGYYLALKTFTGGFDFYTGTSINAGYIKINPNGPSGWNITRTVPTGESLYIQINSRNIFDNISGSFNARVFSGDKLGSVDTNMIYASRLY
jgi:hypothetical protein